MSKIVLLTDDYPPLSFGGAGIVVKNLALELTAFGHQVVVVTSVRQKTLAGLAEEEGVKVYKLYSDYPERWRAYLGLFNPGPVFGLKKILAAEKPDVVHAHNLHYHLSWSALVVAARFTRALFLTAHDTQSFAYAKIFPRAGRTDYRLSSFDLWRQAGWRFNPLRNWLIRKCLRPVAKIFCVSHSLEQALTANGLFNTVTIHNGIDSRLWPVPAELIAETKQKYALTDKQVLLFAGRLSGAKGGERLVAAFNDAQKHLPELRLLVLGQDLAYAAALKKEIKSRGLSDKIIFSGWLSGSELKAAYWSADLVVVPSLYLDPFPTVNLEAMACHKPVLGTCWGGTPEAINDGGNGRIINPDQLTDFSQAIVRLFSDRKRLAQMGEEGYNRVSTELSLAHQADTILDWYQKFLF